MLQRLVFIASFIILLTNCGGRVEEVEYTLGGQLKGIGNGHLPPAKSEIDCDNSFTGFYGEKGISLTTTPYPPNFHGSKTIRELRDAIAEGQTTFTPGWPIKARVIGLTTFSGNVSRRNFYIQDATGGIYVAATSNILPSTSDSQLGQEITATVTQADISNNGVYRIRDMTGVSVVNNTNPLYVKDITNDSLEAEGLLVRYCGMVVNAQTSQFEVAGRPMVYFGGSSPGTDDIGILNGDFVTVVAPLTQFNGKAQVSLNQSGAYPATLSKYVRKYQP